MIGRGARRVTPAKGPVEKASDMSSRVVAAFRGLDVAISVGSSATTWRLPRFDEMPVGIHLCSQ
jgi:hypothetical protein